MDNGIGRTADGAYDTNGILKGLTRQDLRHGQVFPDRLHDALAGHMSEHIAPGIYRWYGRVARHADAQGFDDAGHGRGGTHCHAMTGGPVHAGFRFEELTDAHGSGAHLFAESVDVRPRSDILSFELAVEHRTARDRDGRQVATRRPQKQSRRSLVAPDEQDHTIHRIRPDGLFHIHADQISEQHRRRPHQRLPERHYRKFHRQPTGLVDAAFNAFCYDSKMGITRRQFRPGIADSNDWAPVK